MNSSFLRVTTAFAVVAAGMMAVVAPTVNGATQYNTKLVLEGWCNLANAWGGTVQTSNSKYSDGDTLPLRCQASLLPGSSNTVLLKYDFSSGGSARFFDSLGSYKQGNPDTNLLSGISGAGSPSQWAIPLDPLLPAGAQIPGVLITYNLSKVTFGAYTLVNGVKVLPVNFVVAGTGKTAVTVVIGYGGHLAGQVAWGVGNGASTFPGASRKAYASLNGCSDVNVAVNPGTVIASADLGISQQATPQPVYSGDPLSYQLTIQNPGPDQACSVTVTDSLPAGVTLKSVSTSQGTWSGTTNLAFALGNINAGASASISISMTVSSTAPSIANTAVVNSLTQDPNLLNNTATVTSTILIRDTTPPQILACTNITQGTDPGQCSAKVTYNVSATDNQPGVKLVCSPPSGSTFPLGTTTVQCVATDTSGNSSSCSFTVTIVDREPPQIFCPPTLAVSSLQGSCDTPVAFTPPTASDNCGGAVPVICTPPSGSTFSVGTNLVICTATDPAGNTSSCAFAVVVQDVGNQAWPQALPLTLVDNGGVQVATARQCLNRLDQSRWFKFKIQPNSRIFVTLSDLPENYDLVLFKDIAAAYTSLNSAQDLVRLSAEFASDAFSPSAFSPDAFSPSAFSPSAFSPSAFSPSAFSPSAFSPSAFSPSAFSPSAFSPDAFSPSAFSPSAFSPSAFSPSAFSPSAFSPSAFSPSAFSAAQIQSVIAASAFDGVTSEGVVVNTWDNDGYFYVRVRGRNGVASSGRPFSLAVFEVPGPCGSVSKVPVDSSGQPLPADPPPAPAGNYRTLILTDLDRLTGPGPSTVKSNLTDKLNALASRPEVAGIVVDLASDPAINFFNAQADKYYDCPYAKNLLAGAIKRIVASYRGANPLQYVVLAGSDAVVPFFRYPDEALLGPERNYVPPVRDLTTSQASLKLNYVLSQDAYGAQCTVSYKNGELPLPDLAVGRLVESPAEISALIDAYLQTPDGQVPTPNSALVTGYDFLADVATAVRDEFSLGLGAAPDTLISPNSLAPSLCWTADDLRQAMFSKPHSLIFLAGHFSASSAMAADYATQLSASEVAASTTDFRNAIIFSAGCHSGYNIVSSDSIPYVTPDPDWPQAFARKQATLIAGTGYQYGDTDYIEYSERLYLNFAKQLRTGSGPVAIGKALLNAKRAYLTATPQMRGIHAKSYLEVALFGLPMLQVNLPGSRRQNDTTSPVVASLTPVATNPGATLGLRTADLGITPALVPSDVVLNNTEDGTQITATFLAGGDGIINNPAEPILPLESRDVTFPSFVLRGIGFRGGSYSDLLGKVPLTGAAATEIRGIHATFLSEVFYPVRPWSANYFDAFCGGFNGSTLLLAIPAQFKSDSPTAATGTIRAFSQMDFRLYYSSNTVTYLDAQGNASTPGLAAPPAISGVVGITSAAGDNVALSAQVVGNPAAGIQAVWVTWTAVAGPSAGKWQSLDLIQNPANSTLWEGVLNLNGTPSGNIRYLVQAVNGVGLVTLDTKLGAYHIPDEFDSGSTAQLAPTSVTLLAAGTNGAFGDTTRFTALLQGAGNTPLPSQRIVFSIGDQEVWATTDANGQASGALALRSAPAGYQLKASFPGATGLAPSFVIQPFTIDRQVTHLGIAPSIVYVKPNTDSKIVATLTDATGDRVIERTILFSVQGPNGAYGLPVITGPNGEARLGQVPLPAGEYNVVAYFNGTIGLPGQTITVDDGRYQASSTAGSINVTLVVDDQPPSITCPGTLLQATDPDRCDAVVTFTVAAADDHPGVTLVCTPPSGSVFPKGTNVVNCVATDLAGNQRACSFNVVVFDGQSPQITCPANILVSTDPGLPTAVVNFTVLAADNCPGVAVATSQPSGTAFPIGTNTVTCIATDTSGNQAACSFTIVVRDTESPKIKSISASPNVLSPPNHAMIPVVISLNTTDNSGTASASVVSITSNEPLNTTGDGCTSVDYQITGPLTVKLRAERAQNGNGRTYSITVKVVDLAGNTTFGTTTVFVPK